MASITKRTGPTLSDDVMMRSGPDATADDGVHAQFLFDGGKTLVSYRDEHAVVQRKQDDGSVLVIAYRYGGETERLTVPRAAIGGDDPAAN